MDSSSILIIQSDYEANSSATHHTLQNLQPGSSYRVGIQAATADENGSCSPQHQFKTTKLGNSQQILPPCLLGPGRGQKQTRCGTSGFRFSDEALSA